MELELEEIYSRQTYLGQMAGCPEPEESIRRATRGLPRVFGRDLPTHTIAPKVTPVTSGPRTFNTIPRWTHAAVLVGPAATKEADGAHLLVVWFSNEATPILPKIEEDVWKEKAQDWNY